MNNVIGTGSTLTSSLLLPAHSTYDRDKLADDIIDPRASWNAAEGVAVMMVAIRGANVNAFMIIL